MTIFANDPNRTTNAQAIADLHELGWLTDDQTFLDMTVGPEAGFWKLWTPARIMTNDLDLDVDAEYHVNAVTFGWPMNSHDVAVWDPPYGYRGTSQLESDKTYGLTEYNSADAIDERLVAGTLVAMDIARQLVLVKCQDANVASRFRDQSGMVTDAVRKAGGRVAGKLYVHARREQPKDKKQLNIWGYDSVLLIIKP